MEALDTKIISEKEIETGAEIIRQGGLVIFPTETVYGLWANALDSTASAKIYAAKGRPSDNPLICHLASADDAEKYCIVNEMYKKLAARFMPGPITVILPKKYNENGEPIVPDTTTGGLDSVAVRVPSNRIARKLIEKSGLPVAAPSANISGSPSPTTLRHVLEDMYGRVDCIIDGGDSEIGLESTIVMPKEDKIYLLRPGAVTIEMLRDVCDNIVVDASVTQKSDARPLAPGMKYRHYAPKSKVVMLDGDDESVYEYLADKTDCAILCYDGDKCLLCRDHAMSLGDKNDHLTQAHRLFAALRDLDGVGTIYARMPSREGVGLAVFNRMVKAAGYEIIELK
jgi:L-threonylcarbamoyladenylate synthase